MLFFFLFITQNQKQSSKAHCLINEELFLFVSMLPLYSSIYSNKLLSVKIIMMDNQRGMWSIKISLTSLNLGIYIFPEMTLWL